MADTPKISQAEFASKIRQKYNAYQDVDDSTLVSKFIEKYPVYADRVELSKQQEAPIAQSKLKEAVAKDRSKVSSFMDIMLPDYVKIGYNAAKTLGSIVEGAAAGAEALIYTMGEVASRGIPSAGVGAPSLNGPVSTPTKEQRKEMMSSIRTAGKQFREKIPLKYTPQEAKLDVTDGLGFEDLKALPELAGRIAFDIPLGMSTGGASYFVQGYGDAIKTYDEQVEKTGIEPDEKARQFFGVAGGTINGLLETFAIDKIFKGPAFTKLKTKIYADVVKRAATYEGKMGIDAIQRLAEEETKKAMSTFKNRGIKALYAAGVESSTEGLQTGLEEVAKMTSNAIQDKELFDEKEIKDNLLKNILNSAVAGGIMGGTVGGIHSLMSDTRNQILDQVANAKTPEDIKSIIDNLQTVFQEENMSPDEQQLVINQTKKYAEIKQTIPNNISAQAQNQAIQLIETRNEIDEAIRQKEEAMKSMDEAVAADENNMLEKMKDARNSYNDRIRDVVSGEKTKYYEEDGKHFKQVGDNEPEPISKNRYEFEQMYDEDTPVEENVNEKQHKEAIDNINKQRQEEYDSLQKTPLTNVDEYNGKFDNRSVKRYANKIRKNNKLSKKADAALTLWENTIRDINSKYDEQIDLQNQKYRENAITIRQGQEGPTTGRVSEYQGTQSEQTQTTNEADNSNRPVSGETQQRVLIGDKVIWNQPGVPTNNQERKVVGLSEDGNSVLLEGINESVPLSEVTVSSPILERLSENENFPTKAIKPFRIFGKDFNPRLAFKKLFSPFGVIGRGWTKMLDRKIGKVKSELKKAEILLQEVRRLSEKYKGIVTQEDIDAVLTGNTPKNSIPVDMLAKLKEMRKHIDGLTEELIQSGVITDEEEIKAFRENKGSYLVRAYEVFDKKGVNVDNVVNKLENVDQATLDNALEFLKEEIKKSEKKKGNDISDEEAMNMAKRRANQILADQPNPFTKKSINGSLNIRGLMERQDIAAPIRALMGEYTEPLQKYAFTAFKMAELIASQKYMTELREVGMGKFLFEEGDPKAPAEASHRIAADVSPSMAPLEGLYTFPELYNELTKVEEFNTWMLTKFFGVIRGFKTVYNPATHVKNVIGNIGFMAANGYWTDADASFKILKELFSKGDKANINELIINLNKYNVLNNSVGLGELKSFFNSHSSLDELLSNIRNYKETAKGTVRKLKNIPRSVQEAYQLEDDIFKIIAFVSESNRSSRALFNKEYTSLSKSDKEIVDNHVAEIVKSVFPTFPRVPKFIQGLSKSFLLGNFLAFQAESVRVSINSVKLATKEIRSGNKQLRRIGWSRLAGNAAYNIALESLVGYAAVLGVGGLVGFLADRDEEKKNAKNMRRFLPPWNQNTKIMVMQYSNGKLAYLDIGSSDPFGYQKGIWNVFWNNMNNQEGTYKSLFRSIAKAIAPLTEIDMTYKALVDLHDNKDENGNPIFRESDNKEDRYKSILKYLNKKFSPGVVNTAYRLYDSYNSDKDKFKAEVGSLTGVRMYTVDLAKQFGIAIHQKNNSVINPSGGFKDRIKNDFEKKWYSIKISDMPDDIKQREYERLADGIKDILKEMRGYYEGAANGGVPIHELNTIVEKSGLSDTQKAAVRLNNFDLANSYYLRR